MTMLITHNYAGENAAVLRVFLFSFWYQMGKPGALIVCFSIPQYADTDLCGVVDSHENKRCHKKILNNENHSMENTATWESFLAFFSI